MGEQRRLTKGNIAAYGCGNLGYNFINFLSNFGMLFMTDYLGMNAGIVAGLIAVSKVLDGISDILAGTIIDRTKSKMGKARVWILRMSPLMVAVSILFFFNPTEAPEVVTYIYFFIAYTLFNDVFYTMYYVANSSMILYMTNHTQERVYLSIMSQFGNVVSGALVTGTYLILIGKFGGGIHGWRMVSIIYGAIFLILQLIYIFSVKEMPHMEKNDSSNSVWADLVRNIKYLLRNKYFIMQFLIFFFYTCGIILFATVIPYYCMRVLGDIDNSRGTQTWLSLLCSGIVLGLMFAPILMKKLGMYKCNLYTRIASCLVYVGVIVGVYTNNYPLILVFEAIFFLLQGPYLGTNGALIGKICEYTKLKDGVNVEATVSSCNSMGSKIGNAFGVAIVGWLLGVVHYDGTMLVQPDNVLNMITGIFAFAPIIFQVIILILLAMMNVEKAVEKLQHEKKN